MPLWKRLYETTIAETSVTELRQLAALTERAISLRLQEITNEPELSAERIELDNAATAVKILLREIEAWENCGAE
jgi:hypothetical protein